jgi:phosphoribosylformylglycinamidine synthase
MWQLSEAIDGMSEACLALGLPVIGGNVSLYNESHGRDIDPTPVIGGLGVIDHLAARPPGITLVDDATMVLLDASPRAVASSAVTPSLAGSRWAVELRGNRDGTLPPLDLAAHARLVEFVTTVVATTVGGDQGMVDGIHDVSGGGLGVALAEMSMRSGIGVTVSGIDDHRELFFEGPSRVVVCTTRSHDLLAAAADAGVAFRVLGTTGGDRITIGGLVDVAVTEATAAWRGRLPDLLDSVAPVTN